MRAIASWVHRMLHLQQYRDAAERQAAFLANVDPDIHTIDIGGLDRHMKRDCWCFPTRVDDNGRNLWRHYADEQDRRANEASLAESLARGHGVPHTGDTSPKTAKIIFRELP